MTAGRFAMTAAVLWAATTFAQPAVEDADVAAVRAAFEFGNYEEALAAAQARIDRGELSPQELTELHKYAGLSALNLARTEDAERHLLAALRVNPELRLDPFLIPPRAIQFFDRIKVANAAELEQIRQAQRAEQLAREQAEAERKRREEEEQRRRLEELGRKITYRTTEKKSWFANFLPFGIGQFQQDRPTLGILLASVEGALLTGSIIAWGGYNSLIITSSVILTDRQDPKTGKNPQIDVEWVPSEYAVRERNWKIAHYAGAGVFLAVYAYGVVDALIGHEDEVTTTTVEEKPSAAPPANGGAHLYITPLPGGAAAGLHLRF